MKIVIVGAGLVGVRTAEALARWGHVDVELVAFARRAPELPAVRTSSGWPQPSALSADLVVIATASTRQYEIARPLVEAGVSVIATADNPRVVRRLWALHNLARNTGSALVVGAAYSPGVSSLLAVHLAAGLDRVTAIRTAQFGTGGPACAREHHRATGAIAQEVQNGTLRFARGGSGRELVWFPEPIGAADCYRAGLIEPFLLHQLFPEVPRIEARQAATRRDRVTSRIPMLRPPHPEGLLGAVWAEVRGEVKGRVEHRTMAASAPQATGAAAMVSAWVRAVNEDKGMMSPGIQSAVRFENRVSLLRDVSKEVRIWTYVGAEAVTKSGNPPSLHAARKWSVGRKTAE